MGAWGFVALAYGLVWGIIAVYWVLLKNRYRKAEAELNHVKSLGARQNVVKE